MPPLEGQLREQKVDALAEAAHVHVEPLRATVGRGVEPASVVQQRVEHRRGAVGRAGDAARRRLRARRAAG